MGVDPRQILAGFLTVTMFVMLANMIKREHFDSVSPFPLQGCGLLSLRSSMIFLGFDECFPFHCAWFVFWFQFGLVLGGRVQTHLWVVVFLLFSSLNSVIFLGLHQLFHFILLGLSVFVGSNLAWLWFCESKPTCVL